MCFETALVLAYLTKRRLVMPKEYRRECEPEVRAGRFRPLHPAECFELETLDGIVHTMARDEYDRRIAAGGVDRADLVFRPGAAVFCFPKIPAANSPEAVRLRDFAAGRRFALEITPQMEACRTLNIRSPTLEQFYSFFFLSLPQDELACKRLIRDCVRFRPAIVDAARRIAASLGNYSALHVRRNDFFRQYPEQNVPADQLACNVMKRVPAGARLYIATDETDRGFFAPLRDRFEVYFIDCFRGLIPDNMLAGPLACVEQLVCAFANLFIGTRLSTFSAYITRLRGYRAAADTGSYFTDGSPGSEMDDRGAPAYSWINWMRSGNPLWGREFKEAWEI